MKLALRGMLVVLVFAGSLRPLLAAGCDPVRSGGPPGWTSRAAMPSVRLGATGVMVGSRIYVTHGSSPTGGPDARTFIYDRVLNTWSEGASAHFPRTLLTGVCVEDLFGQGLVVAVGGDTLDGPAATMEIYDPAANYWTTGPPMPTARWGSGAAFVPGPGVLGGSRGSIYVVGGTGAGGSPLAVNEAYDVQAGRWVARAPLPIPMSGVFSTLFLPETGLIYVLGGYGGSSVSGAVQIYDPNADRWAPGSPMTTPRSDLISGVCGGAIFAIGGVDEAGNLSVNEAYDPLGNSWFSAPAKPAAASLMASEFVSSGLEIYALGGTAVARASTNDVFTCGVMLSCSSDPDCDDASPCTGDTCDPIDGACAHDFYAPAAVGNSVRAAHDRSTGLTALSWSATSCASLSNVYRGTIPAGLMGSRGQSPYDHVCFENGDTTGDGATLSTDPTAPPRGTAFYYLVATENPGSESSLGTASGGAPIPNNFPCPTPPP